MKSLLSSLLIILSSLIFSQNQDLININPTRCFPGGEIEIFGWVKPNHPQSTIVQLHFTKPVSGKMLTKNIKTSADGNYSYLFKDTDEIGIWKVKAQKSGTRTSAEAEFEVSSTIFLISLSTEIKDLGDQTREAYTYFKELLQKYPDFAGKEEILNDVDELFNNLQTMQSILDLLEQDVKLLNKALKEHFASIPDQARDALAEASDTANKACKETVKQTKDIGEVLESSREEAEWCYIWMSYYNLCQELKFYNNFIATSFKGIAKNFLIAETTQGMNYPLKKLIKTVIKKLSGSKTTPVSIAKKGMNIIANLGTKIYGKLMSNCTNFTGEAEGDYKTDLLSKGMTFFTMKYKLSAKINLTFQKRKPGDPAVYLKGNFKGKIGQCECFISMAPFAQPDTIGPVWCLSATPLAASHSFLLYLEGKAVNDLMELKLEKVGHDFKLKARAFYVMLSSAAYNLPVPGDFSFPLQNAAWFLTRTTKISSPKIEYFKLPIKIEGNISKAEKIFKREIYLPETKKRVGVKVNMTLKIKIKTF